MRKQDYTFQEKLNELRLDIPHPNNKGVVFILLEGESDIQLFRKLVDRSKCKVEIVPGGKYKLEECVGILVKIYPLIIGIRDADFIHLEVFEFTDLPKDKHFEIRTNIMLSIEQISYLKWLNEIENLEYKFDAGFQDLISFVNLKIDFEQYFSRVMSKSPNAKITDRTIILNKMRVLKDANPDPLQLCNGHDFMKAFSQYLKQNCDVKNVNEEHVTSAFRMIFTFDHYSRTKLYIKTKMWADDIKCIIY